MFVKSNNTSGRKWRRAKALRTFLEVLLFFSLLLCLFVLGGRALCKVAIDQIAELTNTRITTESVEFRFNCSVLIKGLEIKPRDKTKNNKRILRAETVYARFGVGGMLLLRPQLKKVRVKDFIFEARYDMDKGYWNLADLQIKPLKGGGGTIPLIDLKRGTLQYIRVSGGDRKIVAVIPVKAKFAPSEEGNKYRFDITTGQLGRFAMSRLKGHWRPGKLVVSGGISSSEGEGIEKQWSIGALASELNYDEKNNFALRLVMNDLVSKQAIGDDNIAFNRPASFEKLEFVKALQRFFNRYRPAGRMDINLEVSGNFGRLNKSKVSGKVICKDVSICKDSFPYVMEHLAGRIDFTESNAAFTNLRGKHKDVKLVIEGFSKNFGHSPQYDIRIKSNNMVLDDDLYRALNSKHKKLWSDFNPSGVVSIDYRRTRSSATSKKSELTVELLGVEAAYRHFYYPLTDLKGRLLFSGDNITVSKVSSKTNGRNITLNGIVTGCRGERPDYDISITGENVALDSVLMSAMPEKERRFCSQLSKAGTILLENLHCRIRGPGKTGKPGYKLSLDTGTLEVNDGLLKSLPAVLADAVIKLRPAGKVSLKLNLNKPAGAEQLDYETKVNCLGVSAELENFAYRLKDIRGVFGVTSDSIRLQNITARLTDAVETADSDSVIKINGQLGIGKNGFGSGRLRIQARDVLLSERFAASVPADIRGAYERFCTAGRFDLNDVDVSILCDADNKKTYEFAGEAVLRDCAFKTLPAANKLDANVEITGGYSGTDGLRNVKAKIKSGSVRVGGRLLEKFAADVDYDQEFRRWHIKNLAANCYGGKVIGDFETKASADKTTEYELGICLKNVDLKQFLEDNDEPAGSPDYRQNGRTSGKMSGTLTFRGQVGESSSRIGRCKLEISNMKVGKPSPVAKLLNVLKLTEPSHFVFEKMFIDSYIKNDKMLFEQVDLSGRSVAFHGSGWMDLKDYNIELVLTARGQRQATDEPSVLQSLTENLGRGVVRMEVSGDFYDPQVTTTTLPVIRDTFELLGTK